MKIICIGRNYKKHAWELNNAVPEEPVFFMKPDSCIVKGNKPFFYPDFSNEVHFETEIVIRINRLGKNISREYASRYYQEIGMGIDFTARDVQHRLIEKGLPWEKAKAFDNAAPLSKLVSRNKFADIHALSFELKINDKLVQQGNTSDMIFSFDEIISHVSTYMTLKTGDLIFTGTPDGVGPVKKNDHLVASVEGEVFMDFYVK